VSWWQREQPNPEGDVVQAAIVWRSLELRARHAKTFGAKARARAMTPVAKRRLRRAVDTLMGG
jgi:hypothetical protein